MALTNDLMAVVSEDPRVDGVRRLRLGVFGTLDGHMNDACAVVYFNGRCVKSSAICTSSLSIFAMNKDKKCDGYDVRSGRRVVTFQVGSE